jgi:putative component of toxin-antitoxin plasmid stabilization module
MIQIQQTEAYVKWFSGLRDRVARARIDVRIRNAKALAKALKE